MKHLKRIFETNKDDLMEYIKMCFVDLLDDGNEFDISEDYCRLQIKLVEKIEDTIESVSELGSKIVETTDIISGSMEKVKLEYPNIKYSVHFTRTTLAGEINYVIWILIHLTGDDSDKLYNRIAIGRNPIS